MLIDSKAIHCIKIQTMALFKKSFIDENTNSIKIDKLLEFSKNINNTEQQAEVIGYILDLLKQETGVASVGLFMKDKNNTKMLKVTINGIDDAKKTTENSQSHFQDILSARDSVFHSFERGQAPLPENLFIKGLTDYILTNIISGKENYGLLKIDLKNQVTISQNDKDTMQLLTQLFVHRWEELVEREQLIKSRREGWFNKALLELRNITETNEAPKLLAKLIKEFNQNNPVFSLPNKWRFYYLENKQLKYIDLSNVYYKTVRFQNDAYYDKGSHIYHFIDSARPYCLYEDEDLKKNSLQGFSRPKEGSPSSLCIQTGLKANQIPGWGGSHGSNLLVVIWSENGKILNDYQQEYIDLVKQFSSQIKATQTRSSKIDKAYLKKMEETGDQLSRKHDKRVLVDYLIQRARSLVPNTIIASYGEVEFKQKDSPKIRIIEATAGYNKNYLTPHSPEPESLWHRLLETQATIAVNNTYDENLPKIAITPIDGIHSAISIPIFDDNDKLNGILNLCSVMENTYLSDQQGILEWLARTFGSRLREIKQENSSRQSKYSKAKNHTEDRRGNKTNREIQSVNQLLKLFSDELSSKKELDAVVTEAIKIAISHIDCSCWGVFKGKHISSYSLIANQGLKKMDQSISSALQFSPVKDIIYGEKDEIIEDDIRSAPYFKRLLPLFTGQQSCLATPIKVISYRDLNNSSQEQARETENQYAVFIFHVSKAHFSGNDLTFLQINISLIQELMRQRAFQNELDRIMPLSVSGRMAAQVAHEIKNPCQPLANFISVMENSWLSLDSQQNLWSNSEFIDGMKQRINDAKHALDRINKNVVHLMNLSDITHMRMSQVSIEEILKDICSYEWYSSESISLKKEKPIQLTITSLPPNLPDLRFDKFHLSTMLTNLIQNAFQAIEASIKSTGTVTLGVKLEEQLTKQGDAICYPLQIFIKDNGPGISAEVRRRMFSPFETTKATGTGLGCTICKRMIENIGGKIEVDSVIGRGATMRLFFPESHLIYRSGGNHE